MRNPAIMRIMRSAQSIPPHVVKSYFVWKAKMVKANVTAAQMPTAIRTDSASKCAVTVPNMNPSATEKMRETYELILKF